LSSVADKTLTKLDLSDYRAPILETLASIHNNVTNITDQF